MLIRLIVLFTVMTTTVTALPNTTAASSPTPTGMTCEMLNLP